MSSEVEETLKRINSHKGVKGVLIMNAEGIPIRSNLSDEDTENYSALVSQLAIKAHHVVRTLDEGDELAFLRVSKLICGDDCLAGWLVDGVE